MIILLTIYGLALYNKYAGRLRKSWHTWVQFKKFDGDTKD